MTYTYGCTLNHIWNGPDSMVGIARCPHCYGLAIAGGKVKEDPPEIPPRQRGEMLGARFQGIYERGE
jgi:hypothetical protein